MLDRRARREPVFNVPAVVLAVAALLLAIQAVRVLLPEELDLQIVTDLAFVPGRLTYGFSPASVMERIAGWLGSGDVARLRDADYARFFLARPVPAPLTILSYGLLHGGWTHVLLNTVSLVAFGSPVARRVGATRFSVLLIVGSGAGAMAHWACFPFGFTPVVGASAGISAAMGAATRFAFQPVRRMLDEDGQLRELPQPLIPLRALIRDRRAMGFVVAWFVGNALFGTLGAGPGLSDMPVAWQAHIGGFLFGLLLFRWFDPHAGVQEAAPPEAPPDAG